MRSRFYSFGRVFSLLAADEGKSWGFICGALTTFPSNIFNEAAGQNVSVVFGTERELDSPQLVNRGMECCQKNQNDVDLRVWLLVDC